LARGLNALFDDKYQVIALREKFGRSGVPDEEWITALGNEGGWTVLSGDLRIAKKRPSRELFLRSNLVGFFPLPSVLTLPYPKMVARILTVWPEMIELVRVSDRGVYEISIKGSKFRQISS
jgi:hypothetical protein